MFNNEPLKEGQEVFLKRPVQIYAKVIGPREGDLGLPEELVHYVVELFPLEQCYLPGDLELAHWLQPQKARLDLSIPDPVEAPAPVNEEVPNLSGGDPFFDLSQEINKLIAARAYELHECGGFAHGHDVEDWFHAESEILLDVPANIAETETQLTIRAEVHDFGEKDLEILVAPRSVCISGKRQGISKQTEEKSSGYERRANRIFRVLDMPSEIDTAKVDALVGDGILEVKLLKVGSCKVVPVRAKSASA